MIRPSTEEILLKNLQHWEPNDIQIDVGGFFIGDKRMIRQIACTFAFCVRSRILRDVDEVDNHDTGHSVNPVEYLPFCNVAYRYWLYSQRRISPSKSSAKQ